MYYLLGYILLFLLVTCNEIAGVKKLPSYITLCAVDSPNFDECAIINGQKAIPHVVKGDPKLNSPSFEPFKIDYVALDGGRNFKLYIKNVSIIGMSNGILKKFHLDKQNKTINVLLNCPELHVTGIYSMEGKLLITNIKGEGPLNNTFFDNDIAFTLQYNNSKMKNDKTYATIENVTVDFKMKKAHLQFGNLLNNEQISKEMNLLLNENWEIVIQDLLPSTNAVLADITKLALQNVANIIPLDMLTS